MNTRDKRINTASGTTVTVGMRVMDLQGPGDPATGRVVATAANGVVMLTDGGGGMDAGQLVVVGWDDVAVCARQPETDSAAEPADRWQRAIDDAGVRERLEFFDESLGDYPPTAFLVALLDAWDILDGESKTRQLLEAIEVAPVKPNAFRDMMDRRRGAA